MNTKFCENKIIPNALYTTGGPEADFFWDKDMTVKAYADDFKSLEDLYALVIVVISNVNETGEVVTVSKCSAVSMPNRDKYPYVHFSYSYPDSNSGRFVAEEAEISCRI